MVDVMDSTEFRQRIGPALVGEGLITAEQLQTALQHQKRFPFFTIGQIVSILFRVPVGSIDEVNVHKVVLPQLPPVFLTRLVKIAKQDRFTKDFDIRAFIESVEAQVQSFEVVNVVGRSYEKDGDDYHRTEYKSSIQTRMKILLLITTRAEEVVRARTSVLHDSRERGLVMEESDEDLKGGVYFDLRKVFVESVRGQGGGAS